ncbi:hypothetical protein LJK88_36135 [Paenibacillus sp. P26]|nr:hypothetical protein LJK88_36135 [Paenibacillus sp. P26]
MVQGGIEQAIQQAIQRAQQAQQALIQAQSGSDPEQMRGHISDCTKLSKSWSRLNRNTALRPAPKKCSGLSKRCSWRNKRSE